jgi:UDP-N-acetylglucosamine 4,6-dehydratase/5-epimerase
MINKKYFKDKRICIIGGTGSFGATFAQHLKNSEVKSIRILSRDEKKQDDLRRELNDLRFEFILGDVRDKASLYPALRDVEHVFHAAALKQVPSCEFFPLEATKTNVLGTSNVIDVAIEMSVESVVVLSTDKAVYPINAMGISKALMEKVALSALRNSNRSTRIMVTRYGNVMGSRGSVIPLFCELLNSDKPLTLTNPAMTRFMMSLDESVQLVEHAMINGRGGELFVQKAPAATIKQLSGALHKIFKKELNENLIGERHGEKLFESLLSREERVKSIETGNYFHVPLDERNLNYEKYFVEGIVSTEDIPDYNSHNTYQLTSLELEKKLMQLEAVRRYI